MEHRASATFQSSLSSIGVRHVSIVAERRLAFERSLRPNGNILPRISHVFRQPSQIYARGTRSSFSMAPSTASTLESLPMGAFRALLLGLLGTLVFGCASGKPPRSYEHRAWGGLEPEEIRVVVAARAPDFQACYERALKRRPRLRGTVRVNASVAPNGSIAAIETASKTLEDRKVERCLLEVFRSMKFPHARKPTNFSFPLVFRPPPA